MIIKKDGKYHGISYIREDTLKGKYFNTTDLVKWGSEVKLGENNFKSLPKESKKSFHDISFDKCSEVNSFCTNVMISTNYGPISKYLKPTIKDSKIEHSHWYNFSKKDEKAVKFHPESNTNFEKELNEVNFLY